MSKVNSIECHDDWRRVLLIFQSQISRKDDQIKIKCRRPGKASATPPKFNSSPLKRNHSKRKVVLQFLFFRFFQGYDMLNLVGVVGGINQFQKHMRTSRLIISPSTVPNNSWLVFRMIHVHDSRCYQWAKFSPVGLPSWKTPKITSSKRPSCQA